jgi:hypothetical protein
MLVWAPAPRRRKPRASKVNAETSKAGVRPFKPQASSTDRAPAGSEQVRDIRQLGNQRLDWGV